jgi:hypothetical protein
MKPFEYTWMWELKEGVVKAYEFFLDTARSLGKYVVNDRVFAWVGVCAGPKLCAGALPGVDPMYALELTGLSPNDVTIRPDTPYPSLLTLRGDTIQSCGFRTQKYRPVVAGIDIGSWNKNWQPVIPGCTIGFFARRGGDVGIISNNHCTAYSMCNFGGYYVTQPGVYCGGTQQDKIGEDPVYKDYGTGWWLVDAAWVKLEVSYELAVLDEGGVKREPQGSARDPKPGEPVVKFGRGRLTFSTRRGTVQAIGVQAGIYSDCDLHYFEDQILTTPMISGGDSGSGLYSANMEPVGLIFAGNRVTLEGLANRAVLVEKELGVKILTKSVAPPPLSPGALPPYILPITAGVASFTAALYTTR